MKNLAPVQQDLFDDRIAHGSKAVEELSTVQQICRELEAERIRQGITYYVVAQRAKKRSQIGIMRLLKGEYHAPSLAEVATIAEALGKRIVLRDA